MDANVLRWFVVTSKVIHIAICRITTTMPASFHAIGERAIGFNTTIPQNKIYALAIK